MSKRKARQRLATWARRRWADRRRRAIRQAVITVVAVTANIGRAAGPAAVRAYLERIRNDIPDGDVVTIGFQEIDAGDPADETTILRDVFRTEDGWHHSGTDTSEPIVWRGQDARRAGGTAVVLAVKALAGWFPNRRTVTQLLRVLGDGLLAHVNGHAPVPPDRWHGRYVPTPVAHALAHAWRLVHKATRAAIKLARRAEADVVVTQDTNRPHTRRWHRRQVLGTPPASIDRIAVIPGRGRTARLTGTGTVPNGVGEPFHPARWARFTIRPTKETR